MTQPDPAVQQASASSARAAKVSASSDTLEDWLSTRKPPVRETNLDECFVVLEDVAGAVGLLTVSPDEKLVHVRPSNVLRSLEAADTLSHAAVAQEAYSDSGWTADLVEVPDTRQEHDPPPRGAITHLRGFRQNDETLGLVHFKSGHVEPLVQANGTWVSWKPGGEAGIALLSKPQSEILADASGQHMVFGKATYSRDHDTLALVYYDVAEKTWQAATGSLERTKDYTYRLINDGMTVRGGTLLRLGDGSKVHFQTVTVEHRPRFRPVLKINADDWQERDLGALIPNAGSLESSRFLPVPGRPGSFLVHTEKDNHVWLVTNLTAEQPGVSCLTKGNGHERPAIIVRVSLDRSRLPDEDTASDRDGTVTIFMVEQSHERRLWVKREAAGSVASQATFDAWVPLGTSARTIAAPRIMPTGAEVFLVNEGGSGKADRLNAGGIAIERRHFAPDGWHTSVLQATRPDIVDAVKCNAHNTVITLRTKDNAPAYRARAYLKSNYPCVAVVNGVSRHLGPGHRVTVFADHAGLVTVKTRTENMEGPVYTVELPDAPGASGKPTELHADEAIARRLSGREKNARITLEKLEKTGVAEGMQPGDKECFLQLVHDAGEALGGAASGTFFRASGPPKHYVGRLKAAKDAGGTGGWEVKIVNGTLPAYYDLAATASERIEVRPGMRVSNWGFLGDILNWIREAVEKVVNFVVTITKNAIKFVLEIGGKIFDILIESFQGIVRGMEALFQAMAAAIGKVIDAAKALLDIVKALFEVEAIRRTNEGLGYCLKGGLDTLADLFNDKLPELTGTLISRIVDGVEEKIDTLKKYVSDTLSLDTLGETGIPDSEGGKSSHEGRSRLLDKGGVQARWAGDRLNAHRDSLEKALAARTDVLDASVMSDVGALAKLAHDENNPNSLTQAAKQIKDMLEQDLAKGVSGMTLVRLFDYCKVAVRLIGGVIQGALALIFRIIGHAIDAFNKILDTEILIPGIKQLGELVLKRVPTLRDLLTFIPAVAITVFWKINSFLGGGEEMEPFPQARLDDLKKARIFEKPAGQGTAENENVPLAAIILIHYRRMLGLENPGDVRLLKQFADAHRGFVKSITPIVNVIKLLNTVLAATLGAVLNAARDGFNIANWGTGKVSGYIAKIFTVVSIALALLDQYLSMVKSLTMEFLPQTPEGQQWLRQRRLVPPWNWTSISWTLGAIFAFVGFVCFLGETITGMLAWTLVSVIGGTIAVVGTVAYTFALIVKNTDKIRPGNPADGWKIANEFGTIIGGLPSVWSFLVPILSLLKMFRPEVGAIAGGVLLTINASCTLVAGTTSTGKILAEMGAERWG